MLGAERDIIANHVVPGQVRIVFSPVLDLGPNSLNSAAAALCAGEQDPAAFWRYHDSLFQNQGEVYGADRAYFVALAAGLGLDGPAFEACYDGDGARTLAQQLDAARRDAGIVNRPTIDINGQRLIGAQRYSTYAEVIAGLLR